MHEGFKPWSLERSFPHALAAQRHLPGHTDLKTNVLYPMCPQIMGDCLEGQTSAKGAAQRGLHFMPRKGGQTMLWPPPTCLATYLKQVPKEVPSPPSGHQGLQTLCQVRAKQDLLGAQGHCSGRRRPCRAPRPQLSGGCSCSSEEGGM